MMSFAKKPVQQFTQEITFFCHWQLQYFSFSASNKSVMLQQTAALHCIFWILPHKSAEEIPCVCVIPKYSKLFTRKFLYLTDVLYFPSIYVYLTVVLTVMQNRYLYNWILTIYALMCRSQQLVKVGLILAGYPYKKGVYFKFIL